MINQQTNFIEEYKELCLKYNPELIDCYGVAIGYICNKIKIESIETNDINFCNWKGEPCHIGKINKNNLISCANMNYNDMQNFYNYLNNNIFNKKTYIICPSGGLGNILFQYFLGFTLKNEYDCQVFYRKNYNYWRGDMNQYQLFKHLKYIDLQNENTKDFIDYHEKDFFFYDLELDNCDFNHTSTKNFIINGYYQSFKYSNKYIKEIRNELFSNNTYYLEMQSTYNKIKKDKETCLIHVRRGDYLNYQNIHPICNDEYYNNAINILNKNVKYLIFSDDINFIQNWQLIKKLDYEIIYEMNPEKTLMLMSLCDNFIIANSTLSLVAYLLRCNDDAQLCAPKNWFGVDGYKYKIEDIIPPNSYLC
jgi:hypothetical protein